MGVGIAVLFVGLFLIYDAVTRPLVMTVENIGTKTLEFLGATFLIVVGAYLLAWGYSDEAGKDSSRFLKSIFNRLLKGMKR